MNIDTENLRGWLKDKLYISETAISEHPGIRNPWVQGRVEAWQEVLAYIDRETMKGGE